MRGSIKSALVLGAALSLASLTPALALGGGGHGGGGMGGGGHMGGGGMGGGHMAGAGMGGGAAGGVGLGIGGAPVVGGTSFANGGMRGGSTVRGPASFAGNDRDRGGRNRGDRGGFGDGFGFDEGYGYSSPYDTGFYGDPTYDAPDYAQDEGVVRTGRSAARNGDTCTTPVIACGLYHQSFVGHNCSCKVPGGRSPGHVTP